MQAQTPPVEARALWYEAARIANIQTQPLAALDVTTSVRVETRYSGVSRGTERLVFQGRVPKSEHERMRAPFQEGDFGFPLKYGYANVGRVTEGAPELLGRDVFCLYPHQSAYVVPRAAVIALPAGVPAARAVLGANMETALNAVWDARLAAGDSVTVIGAGVVGCLVAYLCARHPGTRVTLVDIDPQKARVAAQLGVEIALAQAAPRDADLVFHASGHPDGLASALSLAGSEATIVELSWYGDQSVRLPLGEAFHAKRLTVRSSQVGEVPPHRRPRWTHRRRLGLALELLRDAALDALITRDCAFADLPKALPDLLREESCELMIRVVY